MKRIVLIIGALLLGLVMRAQSVSYTCRYWFDQNHAQTATTVFCDSTWQAELDVGSLPAGLHTLHLQMADTSMRWNAPESFLFLKTQENPSENLTYHCWFDQDFEDQQTGMFGNGHFLLNVGELDDGLHIVNVALQDGFGTLTTTQSYMFIKVAVQDLFTELQYHCWFDEDYSTVQTGVIANGIFLLDVAELSNGIHKVNVQVNNGSLTAPQSWLFYKVPVGGEGIARWQYWINGDTEHKHTTDLSPTLDTLDIIALLPVETWPIRSSCFHFHPNGDEPYLNAKNEITFRFWSTDNKVLDKSTFYVDEQVQQEIVASVFERNTTETFAAPRDNQIQWFKLDAVSGDYLSFQADKACTMQLFSPSGEEVYIASGSESILLEGFNVWEDGTYYLAVHDVTGSGDEISVTYNWMYRYTIMAYDVHLVGNGGCSTITFQGNGFNSLLDAYLVNYQNDTIQKFYIGHECNTTTTVAFDFYQKNLGVYDIVFQFYGETVRINGALEVQDPVDILLTSSVSYPAQFLRNTPCTYTYTITNNGNMSAYAIPLFVYISTPTEDGITYLDFDGLNLSSIIDKIDLDSLPLSEALELKAWAEEVGDAHHFITTFGIDETTGDSIVIRSNFFFINLAPFETKTLRLSITANELLNVWMTVPNDTIQPLALNRSLIDKYCCVVDKITCVSDLICNATELISLVTGCVPNSPADIVLQIANCICDAFGVFNTALSKKFCESPDPEDLKKAFWENLMTVLDINSVVGLATGCFSKFLPSGKVQNIANFANKISELIKNQFRWASGIQSTVNCYSAFSERKPGCPDGDSDGGPSDPVNSLDPNDIHGYLSESGSHYMRQEIQNVQYEIEFENDTTLATAAAHTIIVRDTLDATKFDLNSLAARSVTIGDKRLDLNGEQTFARTLDLRPELYVIAQVEQDYDPTTGIIQWTIQSLDPMTMEPTDDPNQGVLPVNYYGNGVGFIDYSINLLEPFADGTAISNRAGIIFDQEEVIMTPTWTNIIDAVKPVSYIEEVTFEDDTLNFNFVSSDNRSGVWYHTLYYRNDSTEMEWQVKKAQIIGNDFTLKPDLMTTEFLVMAVDSAGNHEEKDMVAEYVYLYDGPELVCQSDILVQGWNWWSTYLDITLADLKTALVEALPGTTINIKSQTQNVKYQNGRWAGQLTTLDLTRMYMISVENDCEISLVGMPINLSGLTTTINNGANWLAFPYSESMTVANFFGSFPINSDRVKSQSQNAKYQNNRWGGQLNTLVPGKGYIYISNPPGNRTFTFPIGTK